MPNVVDGQELGTVFFLPDVRDAFSADERVFGVDPRSAGGDLLVIERRFTTSFDGDGRTLRIGSPCGSATGCTPISEGIASLRTTLINLVSENRPQSVHADGGSLGDSCD